MECKLVKVDSGYILYGEDNWTIGTTSHENVRGVIEYKLSLKNCEAVSSGYDLVELFDEVDESIDYQEFDFTSFRLGFKKALEILADKNFSEEDIRKAIEFGHKTYHSWKDRNEEKFIQSLQQTEWDVEVVMEPYAVCDFEFEDFINDGKTHIIETKLRPLLDADGCLILKRK